MGWWEANLATECYTCSEYISEILNLDETGTISFEDFNKRILNEEQGPTTVRSFDVQSMSEVVYLLKTPKGSVWMRSKICFREVMIREIRLCMALQKCRTDRILQ